MTLPTSEHPREINKHPDTAVLDPTAMQSAHIDSDAFEHFLRSNYPRERELRNACFHAKKAYETGIMKGSLWRSYQTIKHKHEQLISRAKAQFRGASPHVTCSQDDFDHDIDGDEMREDDSDDDLVEYRGDESFDKDVDDDEDELPEPLQRLAQCSQRENGNTGLPEKRPEKTNKRKPVGSRPLKFLPPGGCGCSCQGVTCDFSDSTYEIRRDMSTNKKCCLKCYQHQNKAWKATFEDYEIGKSSTLHACWLNQGVIVRVYGLGRGNKARATE